LSPAQRFHAVSTLLYWLAVPGRLVFLTAPLFYLYLGLHPFYADVPALACYWGPTLVADLYLNGWLARERRSRLWSEVYEALIAWPVLSAATRATLFRSRRGYRVTGKERARTLRVCVPVALPLAIIAVLTVFGLGAEVTGAFDRASDPTAATVYVAWAVYNLALLGVTLLATIDVPNGRKYDRAAVTRQVVVHAAGGQVHASTVDLSLGGALLRPREPGGLGGLRAGEVIEVALTGSGLWLKAEVVRLVPGTGRPRGHGHQVAVAWTALDDEATARLQEMLIEARAEWCGTVVTETQATLAFVRALRRWHPLAEARL
jgi:cellulose synthase (UDP-forming)